MTTNELEHMILRHRHTKLNYDSTLATPGSPPHTSPMLGVEAMSKGMFRGPSGAEQHEAVVALSIPAESQNSMQVDIPGILDQNAWPPKTHEHQVSPLPSVCRHWQTGPPTAHLTLGQGVSQDLHGESLPRVGLPLVQMVQQNIISESHLKMTPQEIESLSQVWPTLAVRTQQGVFSGISASEVPASGLNCLHIKSMSNPLQGVMVAIYETDQENSAQSECRNLSPQDLPKPQWKCPFLEATGSRLGPQGNTTFIQIDMCCCIGPLHLTSKEPKPESYLIFKVSAFRSHLTGAGHVELDPQLLTFPEFPRRIWQDMHGPRINSHYLGKSMLFIFTPGETQ